MINENSKLIAIDFDGTIVEDRFPSIGKPMVFAFDTLKKLQSDGHRLILWTYRSGQTLIDAVEFCKDNGIEFYAVNSSFDGEEFNIKKQSRKINADIFVDDRNVGGFPGWGEVYQMISGKTSQNMESNFNKKSKKKGFFRF
jgi:hydroxymethylpyrimidine pyrophosphatase-like HAD family hydrolase